MATEPHLIGIAGPSGAGKTALAHALCRTLGAAVTVIPVDAYYREMTTESPAPSDLRNFDHPDAIDDGLLGAHLQALVSGQPVHRPVYDFRSHRRLQETVRVTPASFVVVEGLLTLYWPTTRALMGSRIFLRADVHLCLTRRIERDTQERGRTRESVRQQWTSTVRPMFMRYVEPTAAYADAVFEGTQPIDQLVDTVRRRFGW